MVLPNSKYKQQISMDFFVWSLGVTFRILNVSGFLGLYNHGLLGLCILAVVLNDITKGRVDFLIGSYQGEILGHGILGYGILAS